jgi:hypothetical protein
VTPVAPAATIPWYELRLDDGTTGSPASNLAADYPVPDVWAAADFSRVLVAASMTTADAAEQPDEWPVVEPLADVPSGAAWAFRGEDPAAWHGVYWAPDNETAVVLTGFGFSADDLAGVLPALQIEHDVDGPHVRSTMSSLIPVAGGPGGYYVATYGLGGTGDLPRLAQLTVSGAGAARPLSLLASEADVITPASTAFGAGFRVETSYGTHVWWQIDEGPYWAGLSAPSDEIDGLLTRVARVGDVPVPGSLTPPDQPVLGEPVTTSSWPASAPTTATPPAATTPGPSIATMGSEPAMTAVAPASFPGDGYKPPVAVGESVMLSAAQSIGQLGIEVHASEAVQAAGIAEQLESLRDADRLGDVVIIQTGTNGTVSAADLDRIMATVAEVERVVVMTVHADRPWIAPNNELIRALPDRDSNVVVLDWDHVATARPDVLAPDGIHVAEREVYAAAIAEAAGLR